MLQTTQDLERLIRYHAELGRTKAKPGSALERDHETNELGELVYIHASAAWASAADHVDAWRHLLAHQDIPYPVNAFGALLRGGIEGAVTTQWLLGPSDPLERIGRASQIALSDFAHRADYERARGLDLDIENQAMTWHRRIKEDTRRLGVKTDAGWSFPKMAAEVDAPGRWVYHALSALAHGRLWSINLGRLEDVSNLDGMGRRAAIVRANPDFMLEATRYVIANLRAGLMALEAYVGIPFVNDWWPRLAED
jgi:hypothetical protein